jgi:DNA-directed RNA polymerase subunit RPC12/RpoP
VEVVAVTWIVTCPHCGHKGDSDKDFEISVADECFCPKCGERFELESVEDEDDE